MVTTENETTPRVIAVTGASGGVGRGIARACGAAGWTVWILARRADAGSAVAAEVDELGGRGRFTACDVTDGRSIRDAVDQILAGSGRLDGLVHNSTSGESSQATPFDSITVEQLEDQIAVSVRGLHHLARITRDPLAATRGALVVTTSEAGFEGKKLLAGYAMVKAAQRGIVRGLAREWGPLGIRVNAIAPLAMTEAMERAFHSEPAMEARVRSRIPLDRIGDPETDIGPVVRHLLDDDTRYVTGQTVMVDGGSCQIV